LSASSEKDVADFLSRVVPWPADNGGSGFINVHWLRDKKFSGRCVRDVDDMIAAAAEAVNRKAEAYFCLSRQAQNAGTRTAKNALELKSIWLDIDVKDKDDHYETLQEALDALRAFISRYALPLTSAVVRSGGGIHAYWISDRPLLVEEWRAYASGLKALALEFGLRCDAGITTDPARVLRIPGTKNFKMHPPRPVELLKLGQDYDFATNLAVLKEQATDEPKRKEQPKLNIKVAKKFRGVLDENESLSDGCFDPVTVEQVAAVCPWIKTALETGGADYCEPEWSNTTLLATFMVDGEEVAHRLGNKHPGYIKTHGASTKKKWREKLTARGNGIGPTSCEKIFACKAGGVEACRSCPLFHKKSGPIQLAREVPLRLALPTATSELGSSLSQAKETNINPVAEVMNLCAPGADISTPLTAMNKTYAVVKYGNQIMIALIIAGEISVMKVEDFHKMFANLLIHKKTKRQDGTGATHAIKVSRSWFEWKDRRQYLGRGVVFEPGGPLEVPNDLINLWRGFGIEPKQGDWSLVRNHIRDVICSGNEELFQYLIKWMAYGVQYPDRPIGVAIALRGDEGAGKGFLWRNYGKLFGKHFKHVAHGEHLTGRFNAVLAEACAVFLDEALWAGDRKGEQILKALVTEDTFQLERKFCDPIPAKNRLRIMIASNNQWIVPIGSRGRRYVVIDVDDRYTDENDPAHAAYWEPLQAQFGDHASDDGRAAMLYDLLNMDLNGFNVRAVPNSAAKTEQKLLSQRGTEAWLFDVLQDGAFTTKSTWGGRQAEEKWDEKGVQISLDDAYESYLLFSHDQREYQPRSKAWWSRDLRDVLKDCISFTRPREDLHRRVRMSTFRPLNECRAAYEEFFGAKIEWADLEVEAGDAQEKNHQQADAQIQSAPVQPAVTFNGMSRPSQVSPPATASNTKAIEPERQTHMVAVKDREQPRPVIAVVYDPVDEVDDEATNRLLEWYDL
jgi:Family of unknown function (DUF5906)